MSTKRSTFLRREEAVRCARTTLIDTLRLVDSGLLDEAALGAAMTLAFLARVTDRNRVAKLSATLGGTVRDERVFW